MKDVLLFILVIIISCLFIYGSYWIMKNGSYFFFYEDMVRDTIREMVLPECLKGEKA